MNLNFHRITRRELGISAGALFAATLTVGTALAQDVTTVQMVLWPGPEGDAMQKVLIGT
jgi:hypothetical protein